jgi:hemolysin III
MDPRYYRINQLANIFAPGIGFLLSIPGLLMLLFYANRYGNEWHLISCAIYGASIVIAYACFTLYHVYKFHQRWGQIFKIIDHSSIYLLIAGTYTPFALVFLRGHWGWTLFSVVWGMAIVGIIFKIFFVHRFKVLAPLFYLAMGWLIVFAIKPAMDHIPLSALYLLLAGGLFYSFGLIFYAWKRLLFHHAVWHLFVLAGTALHYSAVFWHVIPAPS